MAKHVLVLGAGASRHYDFPVSREIWDKICLSKSDLGDPQISDLGFHPAKFKTFADRLAYSGVMSVDAFAEYLMDDPDTLYMAKGLIAFSLGIYEGRTNMWGRARDWCRTLANLLIGSELETFPRRDIAIITFNYERSLERYLLDSLIGRFTHRHGLEEIVKTFKRLPIIHIYGQLGSLPELEVRGEPMRPFERIITREQMDTAVKGMHLLPEIKRDSTIGNREAARRCLREATGHVSFLGFAYDPENLRALDLANTHGDKEVFGTTLGFGPNDPIARLNNRMQRDFAVQWHPYAPDMDVFAVVESFPDQTLGPEVGSEPAVPPDDETMLEPDVV